MYVRTYSCSSLFQTSCDDGVWCDDLEWCFRLDSPYHVLGGPLCNASSPNNVRVKMTLYLPSRPAPEEGCSLNPILDDDTLACIQALEDRPQLDKIVILIHGWKESDIVKWVNETHRAINEQDPTAAILVHTI